MIKADNKFSYEDSEGNAQKANFSHFEHLERKVQHLIDVVGIISDILKENNLLRKVDPPYFDQESVFQSLIEPAEEAQPEDE